MKKNTCTVIVPLEKDIPCFGSVETRNERRRRIKEELKKANRKK
jgi:hypothetical protein